MNELTNNEQAVIERIRDVEFGKVEVIIQNGEVVFINETHTTKIDASMV